jgi:uncharacterized membrane protein
VAFVISAIRAVGTDDGDIERYLAYANSVLGRPHSTYYVRPSSGWRADDMGSDPDDWPTVRSAPLAPYRDFSVEYPPGFLPIALAPALLFDDLDAYALAFSVLMGAMLTGALWLAVRAAAEVGIPSERVVGLAIVSVVALGVISVRRYDAVVSLAVMAMVWGSIARRPVIAGIALGLGVATKGIPLLLAPFVVFPFIADRRWRDIAWLACSATCVVALAVVPFFGPALFESVRYHGARPLQVESTWGALLLVAGPIVDARTVQTFGSLNVVSDLDGPLRVIASVLPVIAWLALVVHAARTKADAAQTIRLVAVALVAYMVLGKVLSPQYITWLVPIGVVATLTAGRAERRLFITALALTQLIYPFLYVAPLVWEGSPIFGIVVLARNAVLAAWAVRLIRNHRVRGDSSDASAGASTSALTKQVSSPSIAASPNDRIPRLSESLSAP